VPRRHLAGVERPSAVVCPAAHPAPGHSHLAFQAAPARRNPLAFHIRPAERGHRADRKYLDNRARQPERRSLGDHGVQRRRRPARRSYLAASGPRRRRHPHGLLPRRSGLRVACDHQDRRSRAARRNPEGRCSRQARRVLTDRHSSENRRSRVNPRSPANARSRANRRSPAGRRRNRSPAGCHIRCAAHRHGHRGRPVRRNVRVGSETSRIRPARRRRPAG
jgi:hypothetical protein